MNKRLHLLLALLVVIAAGPLRADTLADTPANRKTQADRYLAAAPPKEMMADMAKAVTANMPEAQKQQVLDMMTKRLDMDALSKAMADSMVKHFTADELKALADFYLSPVGKSAMGKMPAYTADLMPVIQSQMMKTPPAGQ